MRIQAKPTAVFIAGTVCLFALHSQSASAQTLLESNTVTLADANGVSTGSTALQVQYEVYQDTGYYEYDYKVINPPGDPASFNNFQVGFNGSVPDSAFNVSGGSTHEPPDAVGLNWFFSPAILQNNNSGTLTFDSDFAPTLGNANANGGPQPAPWASYPDGSQVAVPNTAIPEPAATSLLLLALPIVSARSRSFLRTMLEKK